jgi:hypothetical protein
MQVFYPEDKISGNLLDDTCQYSVIEGISQGFPKSTNHSSQEVDKQPMNMSHVGRMASHGVDTAYKLIVYISQDTIQNQSNKLYFSDSSPQHHCTLTHD